MATNGENETETTDDLVEGTREAKEVAQGAVQETRHEAEALEDQLEDEGLTPDTDGE